VDAEIKLIDRTLGSDGVVKLRTIEVDDEIFENEARIEKAIDIGICIENQPAPSQILELLFDRSAFNQSPFAKFPRLSEMGSFAREVIC
jgi:hypothetical protein